MAAEKSEFVLTKNDRAGGLRSMRHCVGDDLSATAGWLHASCYYQDVCLDLATEEFLFFGTPGDAEHDGASEVSLGAVNPDWSLADRNLLKWAPTVRPEPLTDNYYYSARGDTVWIPHYPMNGSDMRHVFWDDFLPWVTLKNILFMPDAHIRPLRVNLGKELSGTCEHAASANNDAAMEACTQNYKKWLPLVTSKVGMEKALTAKELRALLPTWPSSSETQESSLVCFPKLAAGYSMLTDHCLKKHGWDARNSVFRFFSCDHGAGRHYVDFKSHLLRAAGIGTKSPEVGKAAGAKNLVLIHLEGDSASVVDSSRSRARSVLAQLRENLEGVATPDEPFQILAVDVAALPPNEQLELVSRASAMVTSSGENTYTGMFLPRW